METTSVCSCVVVLVQGGGHALPGAGEAQLHALPDAGQAQLQVDCLTGVRWCKEAEPRLSCPTWPPSHSQASQNLYFSDIFTHNDNGNIFHYHFHKLFINLFLFIIHIAFTPPPSKATNRLRKL